MSPYHQGGRQGKQRHREDLEEGEAEGVVLLRPAVDQDQVEGVDDGADEAQEVADVDPFRARVVGEDEKPDGGKDKRKYDRRVRLPFKDERFEDGRENDEKPGYEPAVSGSGLEEPRRLEGVTAEKKKAQHASGKHGRPVHLENGPSKERCEDHRAEEEPERKEREDGINRYGLLYDDEAPAPDGRDCRQEEDRRRLEKRSFFIRISEGQPLRTALSSWHRGIVSGEDLADSRYCPVHFLGGYGQRGGEPDHLFVSVLGEEPVLHQLHAVGARLSRLVLYDEPDQETFPPDQGDFGVVEFPEAFHEAGSHLLSPFGQLFVPENSRAACETAAATGFPPKVEPWSPGWNTPITSSPETIAETGYIPPPRALPSTRMSGLIPPTG